MPDFERADLSDRSARGRHRYTASRGPRPPPAGRPCACPGRPRIVPTARSKPWRDDRARRRGRPLPRHQPRQVVGAVGVGLHVAANSVLPSGRERGRRVAVGVRRHSLRLAARLPGTSQSDCTTSANAAWCGWRSRRRRRPSRRASTSRPVPRRRCPVSPPKPGSPSPARCPQAGPWPRRRAVRGYDEQAWLPVVEPAVPVADREAVVDARVVLARPCAPWRPPPCSPRRSSPRDRRRW